MASFPKELRGVLGHQCGALHEQETTSAPVAQLACCVHDQFLVSSDTVEYGVALASQPCDDELAHMESLLT